MSSLIIQAHICAERGETSAMTRKLAASRSFLHPSCSARWKMRSGMALMERIPWEYILLRSFRTSFAKSASCPGPATSSTRSACVLTSGAYPEKNSAAPHRPGYAERRRRKEKMMTAGEGPPRTLGTSIIINIICYHHSEENPI